MISNAESSPARTRATRRSSPTRGSRRARAGPGERTWTALAAIAQVCATRPEKCERDARKGAPGLPARHGDQPAGGPGRRSGACWGCDAGARLHPCKDHRKAHPTWLMPVSCESDIDPTTQTAAPGMLVPGALSRNAVLIRDRTAQPSCGCPDGEERL